MMTFEERLTQANDRIAGYEREMRVQERQSQENSKRQNQRRNHLIGELVTKYFPEVSAIEPGTNEENSTRFEPLEAFLYVLSTDYELVKELQSRVAQLVSDDPSGEWRASV